MFQGFSTHITVITPPVWATLPSSFLRAGFEIACLWMISRSRSKIFSRMRTSNGGPSNQLTCFWLPFSMALLSSRVLWTTLPKPMTSLAVRGALAYHAASWGGDSLEEVEIFEPQRLPSCTFQAFNPGVWHTVPANLLSWLAPGLLWLISRILR